MNNNLRKFMDACENKQKRYVRKLAKEVDFNVREWFEIFQLSIFSFYRRVTAEEYVIKAPSTLRDLIYIAEECEKSGDKNLYKKAVDKISRLDIENKEDIKLLRKSSLEYFRHVGDYLNKKRKFVYLQKK